jgi:hypothetical protein
MIRRSIEWRLAFARARAFLDAHGVEVYNATPGGKLEVFDRVDYDTVMSAER